MSGSRALTFKIASEESEFEQIHRLNYATFVEEIPQHDPNETQQLVDKFHKENVYLICLRGDRVAGMVAVRGKRPFSLDYKLADLDRYLPPGRNVCEVRLLSVERDRRKGPLFWGLIKLLVNYCRRQGYDMAIISGTVRQNRLYRHLGFTPFGPLVGSDGARYQPMYVTSELFEKFVGRLFPHEKPVPAEIFLPGPVAVCPDVQKAMGGPAVSHRSAPFMLRVQEMKRRLCRLVNAPRVEVLLGSGTLANDVVAGQIKLLGQPGLVFANGEFGTRLVDHATRAGLTFTVLEKEWGGVLSRGELERALDMTPRPAWLWMVHCESSTGVLNDLAMARSVCRARSVRLCVDCTSSVGTIPLDLEGVYLASSVSGKGLSSLPGLCLVFYDHEVAPSPRQLPRYLDLGLYAENEGVPFTHSSNLMEALYAALQRYDGPDCFRTLADMGKWLRAHLRAMGFRLVAPEKHAAPAIVTMALPPTVSAECVGEQLEMDGYQLSYRSGYLRDRNWIQISLMGECSRTRLNPLLRVLARVVPKVGKGKRAATEAPSGGADRA